MNKQQCGKCWKFLPNATQAILGDPHDYWVCKDCADKHLGRFKPKRRGTVVVDDAVEIN